MAEPLNGPYTLAKSTRRSTIIWASIPMVPPSPIFPDDLTISWTTGNPLSELVG